MFFEPMRRARSAFVDQVDRFVVNRMGTLLDRSRRGVGRRDADVNRLLRETRVIGADDEFVRSVEDLVARLWGDEPGDQLPDSRIRQAIIDKFHCLYYHSENTTWKDTWYRGVETRKCPLDLWIYQELVHELQPDLVVETGTAFGGSGLYLSDLCDTAGKGHVLTIDIDDRSKVEHPRLTALVGSSVDAAIVQVAKERARDAEVVLVLLDSDHSAGHVLDELRVWSDLVTPGSYVVVEDSNINGHPVYPGFGDGPAEAIEVFLREDDRFRVDESREKFMLTFSPGGFLQRVA